MNVTAAGSGYTSAPSVVFTGGGGSGASGTAILTTATEADLSVTKTDSPDPVIAGTNLTYTLNFASSGPSDAQNVSITDAVPTGTTFVSASAPAGWSTTSPAVGGTGNVIFTKGTAASGETGDFHDRGQRQRQHARRLDDHQHGHGHVGRGRSRAGQQLRHRNHGRRCPGRPVGDQDRLARPGDRRHEPDLHDHRVQ